jgi:hypothetical protein
VRAGPGEVSVEVQGDTMKYQAVGRHSEPHKAGPPEKPVQKVAMDYHRPRLSTADVLRAKATVKYNGKGPTYLVSVGLPEPPGLTAGAGEFAEPVGARRVQKFGVTARQVTLFPRPRRRGGPAQRRLPDGAAERQVLHHLLRRLQPRRPHAGLLQRRPPDLAGAGRERLGSMERTMRQLVESAGWTSSELATIREKADSTTRVVTTITKVAGQTNLLSINAAGEAGKAGEHGRGPWRWRGRPAGWPTRRRWRRWTSRAGCGWCRARCRPAPCRRASSATRCAPATSCSKTPPQSAPRAGAAPGRGRPSGAVLARRFARYVGDGGLARASRQAHARRCPSGGAASCGAGRRPRLVGGSQGAQKPARWQALGAGPHEGRGRRLPAASGRIWENTARAVGAAPANLSGPAAASSPIRPRLATPSLPASASLGPSRGREEGPRVDGGPGQLVARPAGARGGPPAVSVSAGHIRGPPAPPGRSPDRSARAGARLVLRWPPSPSRPRRAGEQFRGAAPQALPA